MYIACLQVPTGFQWATWATKFRGRHFFYVSAQEASQDFDFLGVSEVFEAMLLTLYHGGRLLSYCKGGLGNSLGVAAGE